MAIVNRDLDTSEKKELVNIALTNATTTGGTYLAFVAPFPCEIKNIVVAAGGLSGTPSLEVERYWFAGGLTLYSGIMSALALQVVGTSGVQSVTLAGSAGSTVRMLAANDMLVVTMSGANSAAGNVCVSLVVQKTEDILSMYGSQT